MMSAMAAALLAGCAAAGGSAGGFDFAVIGDMPYTHVQEKEYQRVLAALNATQLAFVVHVGDFQFDARPYNADPSVSAEPCSDENYQAVYDSFQSVRHAFVVTPGDNDWSDCAPLKARKIDVFERLEALRAKFFPSGRSLGGKPIAVQNQSADPRYSKFKENLRWVEGGVVFATVHTVGNNDNVGAGAGTDAEQAERLAANIVWLNAAFAEASQPGRRGLVILTQANLGFENYWPVGPRTRYFLRFIERGEPLPSTDAAYAPYVKALSASLETFTKPVAFFHGDTHILRIDKPLFSARSGRLFENFTRVETFGWPDSHWVRITVDPADPQLFRFNPQIVPANAMSRLPQAR
jgi:hypothetical protein